MQVRPLPIPSADDSIALRIGAMPLPVANSITFCVGKSYLNPSILSEMGNPEPITWDKDSVDPGGQDVIHELYSVFFTRNSHVAPGGMRLGAVPVGALAMARKIGFVSSSAYVSLIVRLLQ